MKSHPVTPPLKEIGNRTPARRPLSRQEALVQAFRNLRRRLGNDILNANKDLETRH